MTQAAADSRHPPGLYVLFFTEMWERFSYYGMRALLVLYLVNALALARDQALHIYAVYTAVVYLTPILGGYIADRWLGAQRAVLVGAVVMALGHFAMAVPQLLYVALGLLVAGNGFFKPNISTLVGRLYGENDPRRDGGFTVFYMGINLGAFFSPLVCGTLGEKLGWHYGFAAAGFGMLAGLAVFSTGQRRIGAAAPAPRDWAVVAGASLAVLSLVIGVVTLWSPVAALWRAAGTGLQLTGAALLVLAAGVPLRAGRGSRPGDAAHPQTARVERDRMLVIMIVAAFVVFFWMGFEQAGGTMNLFADRHTDRLLFGWEMPASYFQAVNPLAILVLAPLFARFWVRLDAARRGPGVVQKQALGLLVLSLAFVVMGVAQGRAELHDQVGPAWLLAAYVLMTAGELCLSPIGLSMVTRLAPARLTALMMGLWFTAVAIANYFAGTLEHLLRGSGIALYWFLVATSAGAGLLLLAISPWLQRRMHGVR